MSVIWGDDTGKTIKEYNNEMLASLIDNDGVYTSITTIEESEDSIISRAAPYYKDIQDMGVYYFRYYRKGNGIGFIKIIVREDADEQYHDAVLTILKSVR